MDILTSLSKLLLPGEVFDYFTITSVSEHKDEVELFLEEKDIIHHPEKGHEYEKNGFYDTMTVQDYPIRGKRAHSKPYMLAVGPPTSLIMPLNPFLEAILSTSRIMEASLLLVTVLPCIRAIEQKLHSP